MREETFLKTDWKFRRCDDADAIRVSCNDSSWETVRVPHDCAINGPFDEKNDLQYMGIAADGRPDGLKHSGRTAALPVAGRSVYRKKIFIPAERCNDVITLEFGGAMFDCNVYVNDKKAGSRFYGYSSFQVDISRFVRFGEENQIAVELNPRFEFSRWYPGAGLYRDVKLLFKSRAHVAYNGTYVVSRMDWEENTAFIDIQTEVCNYDAAEGLHLTSIIYDAEDKEVCRTVSPVHIDNSQTVLQKLRIKNPVLWDISNPVQYRLVSELTIGEKLCDRYETLFGVRTLEFSRDRGFLLNKKQVKIKGVCQHHDLGALGAAMHIDALERQLDLLIEMGCNSIRTSHNPPASELLDLCDKKGLLVMDEAFDEWRSASKVGHGYAYNFDECAKEDIVDFIKRDRNHPCVYMWSIGNEIMDQWSTQGAATAKYLADLVRLTDPTRPITTGYNAPADAIKYKLADQIDIVGLNYGTGSYRDFYEQNPDYIFIGSETESCVSSRGEYAFPVKQCYGRDGQTAPDRYHLTSYDMCAPGWGCPPDQQFEALEENPFMLGEYVWTGFDYLGEPTPFYDEWPSRSSYFGILDLAGLPKDRFYSYQSKWTDKPVLHIFPHWNWEGREGEVTPVHCYTNYERVELFVNGVSMGIRQKTNENMFTKNRMMWDDVVYQPGEIRAAALDKDNNVIAETVIKTASEPCQMELSANKETIAADGESLVFITAKITDKDGNFCPRANNEITFCVENGEFLASDAGDQTSLIPFNESKKPAFNGYIVGIVRSEKGCDKDIVVTVAADGLKDAAITVKTTK